MKKAKMKKTLLRIAVLIVVLSLLLSIFASLAYGADLSTYMSGPGGIGTGEQFTVSLSFSCSETIYGITGNLNYDSSMLSLISTSGSGSFSAMASSSVVADSASGATSGTFAVLTFQATSNFSAGQSTTISLSSVTGSTGSDIAGSGCSTEVYIPGGSGGSGGGSSQGGSTQGGSNPSGSSDASLSSLSVTGFNLSPAFSSSVLEYNIEVPFETTSLEINAVPNDASATISVTNNELKAGKTTDVTVAVTAENGTVSNYIIKTVRKQDPNYISSKNNYLSSLQVTGGLLSPAFDKDILNYVVDVPYNLETVAFTVTAEDPLASFNVLGDINLKKDEDNIFNVVCTAENNESRIYTVTVRRASTYDDYLSKTYINKITRSINDNEDPIVMDMTGASVQIVSADIFKALAGKSNTLVIKTRYGTISFKGSDIEYEINQKNYDLTMLNSSRYSEDILPSLASYNNFVLSTNYKGELPGYATYSVSTGMLPETVVNVYMYDSGKNEFIAVAKSIKVLTGGIVSFELDKGGDFIITTRDISGASDYTSVNRKGNFGFLNNSVVIIILLVVCLGIGFAIGMFVNKTKKQTPANMQQTSKQNQQHKAKEQSTKNNETKNTDSSEAKKEAMADSEKRNKKKNKVSKEARFSKKDKKNPFNKTSDNSEEERSSLEAMLDKLTDENKQNKDE